VDASPRARASPAAAASLAVAGLPAASIRVGSVKRKKRRGWNSLQTKQARFTAAGEPVPVPSRIMTPRPHNAAADASGGDEEDAACHTNSSDVGDRDLKLVVALLSFFTVSSPHVWRVQRVHRNHTRFFCPFRPASFSYSPTLSDEPTLYEKRTRHNPLTDTTCNFVRKKRP